jgi:hypothetical protein
VINLTNRIKKLEKTLTKGKSILRFLERDKEGSGFIITQSSNSDEIGLKIKELNQLEKLDKGENQTLSFIEDVNE